jgi:hypothetical protein
MEKMEMAQKEENILILSSYYPCIWPGSDKNDNNLVKVGRAQQLWCGG